MYTNSNSKSDTTLNKILSDINDVDLRRMFGSSISSVIMKDDKIESKLNKYFDYQVNVRVGDIIKVNDKGNFVVTCVYTDNSVDLCNTNGEKCNTGLYLSDIKKVGKCDVVVTEIEIEV